MIRRSPTSRPPVELEPFQYFMAWHPRLDHDPAQQWLRDTIRSVAAATVRGPSGRGIKIRLLKPT
jgi:DNA-binding transcriptional LysR family regulator